MLMCKCVTPLVCTLMSSIALRVNEDLHTCEKEKGDQRRRESCILYNSVSTVQTCVCLLFQCNISELRCSGSTHTAALTPLGKESLTASQKAPSFSLFTKTTV